jgi:hypothetical protein
MPITSPGRGRVSELQRSIALATCILEDELGHVEQSRKKSDAQLQRHHEELVKAQEELKQQKLREEAAGRQLRSHHDVMQELEKLRNELDDKQRCLESKRLAFLQTVMKPDFDTALFLTNIVRDACGISDKHLEHAIELQKQHADDIRIKMQDFVKVILLGMRKEECTHFVQQILFPAVKLRVIARQTSLLFDENGTMASLEPCLSTTTECLRSHITDLIGRHVIPALIQNVAATMSQTLQNRHQIDCCSNSISEATKTNLIKPQKIVMKNQHAYTMPESKNASEANNHVGIQIEAVKTETRETPDSNTGGENNVHLKTRTEALFGAQAASEVQPAAEVQPTAEARDAAEAQPTAEAWAAAETQAAAEAQAVWTSDQSTVVTEWPVTNNENVTFAQAKAASPSRSTCFADNRHQHETQLKRSFGSPLAAGEQWAGDVINGYGVKLFQNGQLFAGDFVGGQRCGRGVQRWSDGHVFIGEWKNDCRKRGEYRFSYGDKDGSGVVDDDECDRYVGEWAFDKMHGTGKF